MKKIIWIGVMIIMVLITIQGALAWVTCSDNPGVTCDNTSNRIINVKCVTGGGGNCSHAAVSINVDYCPTQIFAEMGGVDTTHNLKLAYSNWTCNGTGVTINLTQLQNAEDNYIGIDLGIDEAGAWYAYQDNGYYATDSNCKPDFYKNGSGLALSGGLSTFYYNESNGETNSSYNIDPINMTYDATNQELVVWCDQRDITSAGIDWSTFRLGISVYENGGLVFDRKLRINETLPGTQDIRFRYSNPGFYPNVSDMFYIPTEGWITKDITTSTWTYPADNNYMPAQVQVNLTYPFWLVYGTNKTFANLNRGSSSNINIEEEMANNSQMRSKTLNSTVYYYMGDLALTSNNTRNDVNKIVWPAFGKYVEWFSRDHYEKRLNYDHNMTSMSMWCYYYNGACNGQPLEKAREIGFEPTFSKWFHGWDTPYTFKYTAGPPESWSWDYIYFSGLRTESLWSAWYELYNDNSILMRSSSGIRNSTTWGDVKVNLGHDNATEFFFNYTINRQDATYVPNITNGNAKYAQVQNIAAYAGSYGLRVYDYGNTTEGSYINSAEFKVSPGTDVNCSCMAKTAQIGTVADNPDICRLNYWNTTTESWVWPVSQTIPYDQVTDWRNISYNYTISNDYTDVSKIRWLIYGAETDGDFYVDSCNFYLNGQIVGFNSDFDSSWNSIENYTRFVYFDNFIDTKDDYTQSAQERTDTRGLDGNLYFLQYMRDKDFNLSTNQWNWQIHTTKYLDFGTMESTVTQYDKGRQGMVSQARYEQMLPALNTFKYMKNPPVPELFNVFMDVQDFSNESYDWFAGVAHGISSIHGTTESFSWSDSNNVYSPNASYIVIRTVAMKPHLPKIRSDCLIIWDSNGTIPFGHKIQVNITTEPCYINTTATHYSLDGGSVQTITGGNLTITGHEAESLHWLEVWSKPFRIQAKDRLIVLYAYQSGNNYIIHTQSPSSYPYAEGTSTVTFYYDGAYEVWNYNTNQQICEESPCTLSYTEDNTKLNLSIRPRTTNTSTPTSYCSISFLFTTVNILAILAITGILIAMISKKMEWRTALALCITTLMLLVINNYFHVATCG